MAAAGDDRQYDPVCTGMEHWQISRIPRACRLPQENNAGVHGISVASVKLQIRISTGDEGFVEPLSPGGYPYRRWNWCEMDFMPEKSAKGKKYEYYIDCREKPDVFSRRYCYHYPEKLDIEAMREAVPYLLGPKNFTSFTDDKDCKDPIRKITNIKIVSSGEKVRITFYGTGFLYHMVRILTGTLLEIGTGKREASMLPVVIAAEDRSLAGFLAPARGLFLRKVYY